MDLINNYTNALQAIYDHVGFVEDWVFYPIDDRTDKYWSVDESNIRYADSIEEFESETGNYYEDELYTQRFYKKWVYRGELITMAFSNPGIDGMKYFAIFDNSKEVKQH